MKNKCQLVVSLILVLCLGACSSISEAYVKTTDEIGLTPEYVKKNRSANLDAMIAQLPKKIPVFKAPLNTPDGEYSNKSRVHQGIIVKSYVMNGQFDRYVDVYYPNNQIQSHTPLVNSLAEGWSIGYVPDGRVRTKFLYKKGVMTSYKLYDPNGKIVREGNLD